MYKRLIDYFFVERSIKMIKQSYKHNMVISSIKNNFIVI